MFSKGRAGGKISRCGLDQHAAFRRDDGVQVSMPGDAWKCGLGDGVVKY